MNKNNELPHCLLSTFNNLITVRLDDTNYVSWRFILESMLVGCDLMGYIDGSVPCPPQYKITTEVGITSELTQEYKVWRQHASALMALLAGTLSSDALSFIVGSKTSKEVWFSLEERHGKLSKFKAFDLKISMQQMQKGNDSIDKYMQRIKTVRDQLSVAGVHIPDDDIVTLILNGLPVHYATIKIVISARKTPTSLNELHTMLLDVESDITQESSSLTSSAPITATLHANTEKDTRIEAGHHHCGSSGTHLSTPVAHQARYLNSIFGAYKHFNQRGRGVDGSGLSNRFSNSSEVCQICNNKGHTAQLCSQRSSPRQIIASGSMMQCQICMKTGHSAAECLHRHNYNFRPTSAAAHALAASFTSHPLSASIATQTSPCLDLSSINASQPPSQSKVTNPLSVAAAPQSSISTLSPLLSYSPSMLTPASIGISDNKTFVSATPFASDRLEWQQAILKEIDTLSTQGTWQLSSTSSDSSLLHCRQASCPMTLWQSLPLIPSG
ncbi:hypothetical protein M0R45_013769 [Rubus argutus]|uniref:CCHC-type domain-containing protein n=1 Tax=Rubus argutus TaxID=59490 RepID=A0AAW1XJE1_RUBAR